MRITPAVRAPIPRYSPFPAIAASIGELTNALDPLNMAKRKLALAQTQNATQMFPLQQQLQRLQIQRMMGLMGGKGSPDYIVGPDGKVHWLSAAQKAQRDRAAQHNATYNQLIDGANAASQGHPVSKPGPAPDWANPSIYQGNAPGSPIPPTGQPALTETGPQGTISDNSSDQNSVAYTGPDLGDNTEPDLGAGDNGEIPT
jgi:hypothetical protein